MGQAVRITSVIGLVLSLARAGSGQTTVTPRPFQGLFGPTANELVRPRQLDLNWSVYGAQDDNSFLSTDADILDTALQNDQMYSGASFSLAYTRRPPRKVLRLNATSAARFYPDLQQVVSTRHSGSVTFDVVPAERWMVQTAGSVSYSPYYTVVLGAAPPLSGVDLIGPSADYAASRQDSMTYSSFIGVTRTLNLKSSMNMSYGLRYNHFLRASQFAEQRAGVGYTRSLSKGLALNLGYSQSAGTSVRGSEEEAPISTRNVDIGLGYNRMLFNSSRTTISVTSGTTTVSTGAGAQFQVTASARLKRRVTRLWSAQLLYDRGVQVPEGTLRPFFSDTFGASVSGHFNSRVMLLAGPTYSRGTVGLGKGNPYTSLANTIRVEIALGRQVALFGEHFYYRYAFANNADLPSMLAGGLNRNGARVGLTLWTPLIR